MVDFSIAGKGAAAWSVTRQFADEGLILENAVDDASKCPSCHVAACHFVDGAYFLTYRAILQADFYLKILKCL